MTPSRKSDCLYPEVGGRWGYQKGCRCDRCRDAISSYKRTMRAANAPWAERERETARRWKRDHLGQPGQPKSVRS